MPEAAEEQARSRSGRCVNHPGVPRVGSCRVCGMPLCLACATPVRGSVVGPECLSGVLDADITPVVRVPPVAPIPGSVLTAIGFALVVVLSVFPWSHGRSSGSSGYFGAWTLHWSLLAVLAGLAGLLFTAMAWRKPPDIRLEVGVVVVLSVTVGLAAVLHHRHPPLLSVSSSAPLLALAGAGIALLGTVRKAARALLARRYRI